MQCSALQEAYPSIEQISYPMSRYDAELLWEYSRQEVRARINSLSTFSFERTRLEYDEDFYATFPHARKAAMDLWISQQYPDVEGSQLYPVAFNPLSMGLSYEQPSAPYIATPIHYPRPTPNFATYSLTQALTLPASYTPLISSPALEESDFALDMSIVDANGGSLQAYDMAQGFSSAPEDALAYDMAQGFSSAPEDALLLFHAPPPGQQDHALFQTEDINLESGPIRRSPRNTRTVRPSPYAYPTSRKSHRSSSEFFSSFCVPSSTACLEQRRYTGDWETDVIAASKENHASGNSFIIMENPAPSLYSAPKKRNVEAPPSRRHSVTRRPHRPAALPRSRPRPHSSKAGKSCGGPERTPHLLPRKRSKPLLRDKDGKPLLACLFCRGRKIACGPPPPGSDDPTCNQCARRKHKCHYPTESHRGMRKKRFEVDALSDCPSSSSFSTTRKAFTSSDDSDYEWDGDQY
ncbi:hypothetical protein C0991_005681 [Blastosporella zonata]|nr:hypothetical protein C0991_005681 [Blastosporella zonata]